MWICRDSTLNQEEPDNNIYSNNLPDIIFLDGITIKEKLIKVDADPLKGYYWPYYLFIPSEVNETEQINLMIGPNNTGIGHNNFKVHDDNAYFEASSGWKSQIARKIGVPLLVPVFPRPYTEWQYYTHSLNREVMLLRSGKLARLDLQLIAMIEDAQEKLSDLGVNTDRKVFMVGYSACGTFSQRFTILHPHLVRAIAAGGINAITTFPVADWNGERLRYAVGIADFEEITGNKFNMDEYIKVPQFLYMGSIDNNDTTLYDDAYERRDAHLIWRFTSRDMPARWEKCENIFYELGIHNARFKTYEGVGHQLTHEMINDVVLFFKENSGE